MEFRGKEILNSLLFGIGSRIWSHATSMKITANIVTGYVILGSLPNLLEPQISPV